MSSEEPAVVTPAQLKAARLLLKMTQQRVGAILGKAPSVIATAEAGSRSFQTVELRLRTFYEAAGVEFLSGGQIRLKDATPRPRDRLHKSPGVR
jgi:transcriptional regulator with XRE-family HTH domain